MKKYSKELIDKYIKGEDIKNHQIEELENDKDFMIQVIKETNDKNFYNLCSEKVKKDYEMVKFLVLNYNNDLDFITSIADEYLKEMGDSLERIELALIMLDLTSTKGDEKAAKYKMIVDTIFFSKRLEVEICKYKENNDDYSKEVGMGFWYMFDLYNSSDIVIKFFAKKTIEAIFSEYDINLEQVLHSKFKKAEDIDLQGINNYMINFLGMYDQMLASYISTHIELLSDFFNKISNVIDNWKNYDEKAERKRYNDMIEQVHEYMENTDSVMTETDILYYVSKQLGIDEKLAYYDGISNEIYADIIQGIDIKDLDNVNDDFVTFTINNSIAERKYYLDVKKIMLNSLFGNEQSKILPTNDINISKNDKCKILKIDFNNKNNSD